MKQLIRFQMTQSIALFPTGGMDYIYTVFENSKLFFFKFPYLPHLHLAPLLGVIPFYFINPQVKFLHDFVQQKLVQSVNF